MFRILIINYMTQDSRHGKASEESYSQYDDKRAGARNAEDWVRELIIFRSTFQKR